MDAIVFTEVASAQLRRSFGVAALMPDIAANMPVPTSLKRAMLITDARMGSKKLPISSGRILWPIARCSSATIPVGFGPTNFLRSSQSVVKILKSNMTHTHTHAPKTLLILLTRRSRAPLLTANLTCSATASRVQASGVCRSSQPRPRSYP